MKKRIALTLVVVGLLFGGGTLFAQDASTADTIKLYKQAFDMIWMVMAAALVFFMQAGFAMVETGLTRAKNAGNIIMKNLMDFSAGAIVYWAIGFGLMFGADSGGILGVSKFFLVGADPATYRDWMFQVVFAATAATIVSGAMAERTKFSAYLIYSVVVSAIIYPFFGHWAWGGGWLGQMGFHDFAGSTVVHSVGGWAALAGAMLLGPRKGKYVKVGGKTVVKAIPGHNIPLAALGVFILWFGWYGFNAGSTLSGTDLSIAHVAATTTIAAAAGAVFAMFTSWVWFGKPDPSMALNGALAGLVAITAPCGAADPIGALIIGIVAGILVVLSVEFIDKVLHIDDPVGAVSVHAVNGAWGTLAVGLFANPANIDGVSGLFYGGGLHQLGVQAVGVLTAFVWVMATGLILFAILKGTIGLRVTSDEELRGLDTGEHGMEAYSGFQIFTTM